MLTSHGAPPPEGDWDTWLRDAVARVSRPVRHPGNHRYVWALDRALARSFPKSLPYPKLDIARGGGSP